MNPITRLSLYLAFSISVLLSLKVGLLIIHVILGFSLIIYEKSHWQEWKELTMPFWKYFPIMGFIFFSISFLVSGREIPIILLDVSLATIRLLVLVSVMTVYTLQAKSDDIISATRSLWYKMNFSWRWVEDLLLFFDMTIRFFPTFKEEWQQMERSQKALSISSPNNFTKKAFQVAYFIPDFIILNLNKADSITGVMEMRGYGQTFPRSIYPLISFRLIDFFWMIAVFAMLFGVHTFVTI